MNKHKSAKAYSSFYAKFEIMCARWIFYNTLGEQNVLFIINGLKTGWDSLAEGFDFQTTVQWP
jgi:hypothetical protein